MIPSNAPLAKLLTLAQASFLARGYSASPELERATVKNLQRLRVPTDGQPATQVNLNFGAALRSCAHD